MLYLNLFIVFMFHPKILLSVCDVHRELREVSMFSRTAKLVDHQQNEKNSKVDTQDVFVVPNRKMISKVSLLYKT